MTNGESRGEMKEAIRSLVAGKHGSTDKRGKGDFTINCGKRRGYADKLLSVD